MLVTFETVGVSSKDGVLCQFQIGGRQGFEFGGRQQKVVSGRARRWRRGRAPGLPRRLRRILTVQTL